MLLEALNHNAKAISELGHYLKQVEASKNSSGSNVHLETNAEQTPERPPIQSCRATPPVDQIYSDVGRSGTEWILESSSSSARSLVRNTIFGELRVDTVTTLHSKKKPGECVDEEKKETTVKRVRFTPAIWLSSKTFLFTYNALKFYGMFRHNRPAAYGLRTVNVIPDYSDIENAISMIDILTVVSLFQQGQASPFDISPDGRTLLGHACFSPLVRPLSTQVPGHTMFSRHYFPIPY